MTAMCLSKPEVERAILGTILLDNGCLSDVTHLRPADFSLDCHRRIYSRIRELAAQDRPVDLVTLSESLASNKEVEWVGGIAYLSSLTEGIPQRRNLANYCDLLREAAAKRHAIATAEAIRLAAENGEGIPELIAKFTSAGEQIAEYSATGIRAFDDIPDIFAVDIAEPSYIVPGLIPRGALILLAGEHGIGKSYFLQRLSISCAADHQFLGRECEKTPVLYLDRENPGCIVRERLQTMAGGPVPNLKVWGGWLPDAVPNLDDPRLLSIAKQQQPVIIVDSLIRFHQGEENSAADMSKVMAKLRALANAGATIITIHHRGKGENAADYRGSSDIGGGPDIVYSLTRDADGFLMLKQAKNRYAAETVITIRPDYASGTFEVTDSPAITERREYQAEIAAIIAAEPGINTRGILAKTKEVGIAKTDTLRLLRVGTGRDWRVEDGPQRSRKYYPIADCSSVPEQFQNG